MITLIFIVFSILIIVLFIDLSFSAWTTHISMNNEQDEHIDIPRIWVTFYQFKKIFDKHKEEYIYDGCFSNSLFSEPYNLHYMHAGIVKINGNIFYFYTPIGYIMYEVYRRHFLKKTFKVKKHFTILKNFKGEL